jgi:formamidopyrimidine-DNA glycosylase
MPTDDVDDVIAAFGFGPEGTLDLLPMHDLAIKMQARGIPIKTLLLDQTFIAGLGNIYVDEALFDARIHPVSPASTLTGPERKRLLAAVPVALEQGLKQGGATIINTRAYPIDGFPAVHGREGEPCFRCGTAIEKTRVGQRGTYFCPTCQKPRRRRTPAVTSVTSRSRSKVDVGAQ